MLILVNLHLTIEKKTNKLHGTPHFLPPEANNQKQGNEEKSYDFTTKYDIYALGGIFYFMITRELPFQDLSIYCEGGEPEKNYNFMKELPVKFQNEFDNIKSSFSERAFYEQLRNYVTTVKQPCMKYNPSPNNDFYNSLKSWQKSLMDIAYECFNANPEERPTAEDIANRILRLVNNDKSFNYAKFYEFYKRVIQNKLPKIYGTSA